MDWISTTAAFLVGTATGASGQYFAMKFTDQRQKKEKIQEEKKAWEGFKKRFPDLHKEMADDFAKQSNSHVRAFFVKDSKTTLGGSTEPAFEYHTDVHEGLQAAMLYLEHYEFVADITPGNCPMYRIKEKMAHILVPKSY